MKKKSVSILFIVVFCISFMIFTSQSYAGKCADVKKAKKVTMREMAGIQKTIENIENKIQARKRHIKHKTDQKEYNAFVKNSRKKIKQLNKELKNKNKHMDALRKKSRKYCK